MMKASPSRWSVLAEVRRRRLLQANRGPTPAAPPFWGATPASAPDIPSSLPPSPAAQQVLSLLQRHPPPSSVESVLSESAFCPMPTNLASLLDLLSPLNSSIALRAFLWSVSHPSFSASSPLLPPRISVLLPPPPPPSVAQFISDLHQFWSSPSSPMPPSLLDPLLSLYCHAAHIDSTLQVLNIILSKHGEPLVHHFNQILQTALHQQRLDTALWLFRRMPAVGRTPNVSSYNIIIHGCCQFNRVQDAFDLFREMTTNGIAPNEGTYSDLISGVTAARQLDTALQLLREMKYNGHMPSEDTYATIMKGFAQKGDHETTSKLLSEMRNDGISLEEGTYEGLVASICRARGVHEAEARRLLDAPSVNYGVWNAGI